MPRFSDAAVERHRERTRGPSREYQHINRATITRARLEKRPFIMWDGEGYRAFSAGSSDTVVEHRYMLFGNSLGYAETGLDLSTKQCLDLLLYTEREHPDAFHVGFAFDYDANMIFRDLSWVHLAVLRDAGQVAWKNYRIKHIPHKMLTVAYKDVSMTVYDTFGFYHCSYVRAIQKYKCGTPEQRERIAAGKKLRSQFTYAQIGEVQKYWWDEISLGPELLESTRDALYASGYFITNWHGPGAVASYILRKTGSRKHKSKEKEVPSGVKVARTLAYAGGRFQSWRGGLYHGPVYCADVNSAYAYAVAKLPSLANGSWQKRDANTVSSVGDIAHFGLYRILYDAGASKARRATEHGIPFPLFHRDRSGHLTWPHRTEVWVWSPEAALVAGNPDAKFLEAWEFHDNGERPFRFMEDIYQTRISLPPNHPARDGYKWALASVYGSFARRVGWDQKSRVAPKSHQLEWAGYITSYCRALVFNAAVDVARRGGLVSIDTDGVTSIVPFNESKLPNGTGTNLGQWKLDTYSGILHWQNGFYWLEDSEGWQVPKTRGIPKGTLSIERALEAIEYSGGLTNLSDATIQYYRTRFVGYGQALNGQFANWRHWINEPVYVRFGGAGKGVHIPAMCGLCQGQNKPMHTIVNIPPDDALSHAHKLPWLEPVFREDEGVERLIFPDDLVGER